MHINFFQFRKLIFNSGREFLQDSQGEVILDKFHNVYSQISSGPNVGPGPGRCGAASKLNGAGRGGATPKLRGAGRGHYELSGAGRGGAIFFES